MKLISALVVGLLLVSAVSAQPLLPDVRLNDNAVSYQVSLYPEYYRDNSASRDMRWVQSNDSELVALWQADGERILGLLTEMSGLSWVEKDFDVFLVRLYPSVGGSDPLTIPLGGMRRHGLTEAAPTGSRMELNLIYQLAHRMLAQAERSADPFERAMIDHPLMQPGAYRRDNLAMLLALVVSQEVIGLDSTYDAYQSAFWKARTPGREVLEKYLLNEWILSYEQPLINWVVNEPYRSELVQVTRPPRKPSRESQQPPAESIEGLPLKGELGFSVSYESGGRLRVDKIDVLRLAYACGLQEGDLIQRVDGVWPRNQKFLVEHILEGLDAGGSTLNVQRDGRSETVVLQPLAYNDDANLIWYDGEDSLYTDPVVPDSTLWPNDEPSTDDGESH